MSLVFRSLLLVCLSSCAPAPRSVADVPVPPAGDERPAAGAAAGTDAGAGGPASGPAVPDAAVRQSEEGDPALAGRAEPGPDGAGAAPATLPSPGPEGGLEEVPPPDLSMFPDAPQEVSVTPPTEGGPTGRPPADHDQPCGDGVCDGPESEQPDLCPRDCQDNPVQGSDWCGDDICDALEQRTQSCPKDCEGARLHGPPEVREGDDPAQGN